MILLQANPIGNIGIFIAVAIAVIILAVFVMIARFYKKVPQGKAMIATGLRGTRVAFDPNVRPALWSGPEETRAALTPFLDAADIPLPSFDDERALFVAE